MKKARNVEDFIVKFNENIRNVLKQKYVGRQINVNFDTYKAIPNGRQTSVFRYIRGDLEKVWDRILQKYNGSEVSITLLVFD